MNAPATIAILVITAAASFQAFRRPDLRERWIFNPRAILAQKEYYRMFTSGFIHSDWMHFTFNAFSFYSFARIIEADYGTGTLLLVYAASIFGGSLLSLLIHRHHEYRALGASGGVCGIIFASIFLLPGMAVTMFPLPIGVPGYVYAPVFLVGSFMAHRRGADNIGHDAHLGGAIVGLLAAAAMYPKMILAAPWTFAVVLGVSLIVLLVLLLDPLHLVKLPFHEQEERGRGERARRYQENSEHNKKLAQMDELLDKVSRGGVKSLSRSERKQLEQLSKQIYGGKRP